MEIKGIDPPPSIKDAMEKQMRADRDKRAVILTAEGQRQSAILTAEGNKQSAILNAEGERESQILRAQADRESQILRAQGEGQAIQTVFQAIHDGQPDQSLLAYQYLQMMPKIAEGDANKVWIVPSEIGKAMEGLGSTMTRLPGIPQESGGPRVRVDMGPSEAEMPRGVTSQDPSSQHPCGRGQAAIAEAQSAANSGATRSGPAGRAPPRRRRTPSPIPRRTLEVRLGLSAAGEPVGQPTGVALRGGRDLLAGVGAGTINTVVGSGTLITFPTLLAFGIPPVTANVSNNVGLVPGSVSGALRLPS